jgi:hypothetical protein
LNYQPEFIMKLSLLAASVFAYTVLTVAWLCYAELSSINPGNMHVSLLF